MMLPREEYLHATLINYIYKPGHVSSMQAVASDKMALARQSAPPLLGEGLVHDLVLDLVPVPQVLEHDDQSLQHVSPPLTAPSATENMICIWQKKSYKFYTASCNGS